MMCPNCNEWIDKPHCTSPSCAWKWCTSCNMDISNTGKSIKHVMLGTINDGRP